MSNNNKKNNKPNVTIPNNDTSTEEVEVKEEEKVEEVKEDTIVEDKKDDQSNNNEKDIQAQIDILKHSRDLKREAQARTFDVLRKAEIDEEIKQLTKQIKELQATFYECSNGTPDPAKFNAVDDYSIKDRRYNSKNRNVVSMQII